MKLLIALLLSPLVLAGCPDTAPPLVPTDVRRDGGTPPDAPPFDAAMDAAPFDASGMDVAAPDVPGLDAPLPDAPLPDAPGTDAPRDGGLPEDVVIVLEDAGDCTSGGDACSCLMHAPACVGGTCDEPRVCVDDGCEPTCIPSGAPCDDTADCPAGGFCRFNGEGRNCVAAAAGCLDSRECPEGFACIGGSCSDRRVGCSPDSPCPYNFYCAGGMGLSRCARVLRPCASDAGCGRALCRDVDGDGDTECVVPGTCDSRTDCAAGDTCATNPNEAFATCGRYGACRTAADCASGQLCQDLWGDGVGECVDPGGTCTQQSDCASGVCGTPAAGGPPSCLVRAFPL